MKSIKGLLLLIVVLTSLSLSARTKFGITAGAVFANIAGKLEHLSM